MNAYWQSWRALAQPHKLMSLLLLLVPIGIIFGRTLSMVCIFAFAVLALHQLATKKITWRMLDPVAKASLVLAFILVCVATPFASMSVLRSLQISLLWLCFPLFYITVTMVCAQTREIFYPSLVAAWVLLIAMVLDGIIQRIAGVDFVGNWAMDTSGRLTGLLTHPNYTATIASFLFLVLAWWVPYVRGRFFLWMFALVLATTGIGILSGDRSAALLLLASLLAGIGLVAWSYPRMRLPALVMIVSVISTIALALHSPYMQDRIFLFEEQLADFPNSPYGQIYQAAFMLWMQSPFTGIGASNFRLACPAIGQLYFLTCNIHPHNYVLEFLTEGGLFACIAWAFVIGGFARLCEYAYRAGGAPRRIAIAGIMIGVFHFFPLIGTQSAFSTWRASLMWYTLAMWTAAWRSHAAPNQRLF